MSSEKALSDGEYAFEEDSHSLGRRRILDITALLTEFPTSSLKVLLQSKLLLQSVQYVSMLQSNENWPATLFTVSQRSSDLGGDVKSPISNPCSTLEKNDQKSSIDLRFSAFYLNPESSPLEREVVTHDFESRVFILLSSPRSGTGDECFVDIGILILSLLSTLLLRTVKFCHALIRLKSVIVRSHRNKRDNKSAIKVE